MPQTALTDEAEMMLSSEMQTAEQAPAEMDLPVARATTLKIVPSTHLSLIHI